MHKLIFATFLICGTPMLAQSQSGMPGMDMSGQDASKQEQDMHDMPGMGGDGSASAMRVMNPTTWTWART